jgi:hypothetical protein
MPVSPFYSQKKKRCARRKITVKYDTKLDTFDYSNLLLLNYCEKKKVYNLTDLERCLTFLKAIDFIGMSAISYLKDNIVKFFLEHKSFGSIVTRLFLQVAIRFKRVKQIFYNELVRMIVATYFLKDGVVGILK